eukprot:GEMP01014237.1.p1 GENE.GEMP01014237.1~~GEMP01014237.1.p1  ORF type:complete len:305 (+),score=88.54 GEMP01014237.1:80-994(+)
MDALKSNPYLLGATAACAGAVMTVMLMSAKEEPQPRGGGNVTAGYMARIGKALAVKFSSPPKHAMRDHKIQLDERGAEGKTLDKRLYMQFNVLDAENGYAALNAESLLHTALQNKKINHVIYADTVNPSSIGVLTWSSDPTFFVDVLRPVLQEKSFAPLKFRPGWQLFGKTYTNGHEKDLEYWLMQKPVDAALNENNRFALWYPMRRNGSFYLLSPKEKCDLVLDHAAIGRAYGVAGHAADIRLNCFGIDADDNEFVVGLLGQELNSLSKVVQDMRVTRHTSQYMDKLGPFFVGQKKFQYNQAA